MDEVMGWIGATVVVGLLLVIVSLALLWIVMWLWRRVREVR